MKNIKNPLLLPTENARTGIKNNGPTIAKIAKSPYINESPEIDIEFGMREKTCSRINCLIVVNICR